MNLPRLEILSQRKSLTFSKTLKDKSEIKMFSHKLHPDVTSGLSLTEFTYIVIAPCGAENTSLVISACKEGAIGIIDLEYGKDLQRAKNAVQKVSASISCSFGVKLNGFYFRSFRQLFPEIPKSSIIILTYTSPGNLKEQVEFLHERGLNVILEATTLKEAIEGEKAKVDGIIAKGNEAGGRVSSENTFVLLQEFIAKLSVPVFVQGGIGLHTAPACYAVGAKGVVLDWQLANVVESSVSEKIKKQIMHMDGSENFCVGEKIGQSYRLYSRPGLPLIKELEETEEKLMQVEDKNERFKKWHEIMNNKISNSENGGILPIGQDIGFAPYFADKYQTTSKLLKELKQSVTSHCRIAQRLKPLSEGRGLSAKHGTRYPIVQGPMSRVSDTPGLALSIAKEGGLPVMAVGMMLPGEIESMLEATKLLLGKLPWGIGLLGYIPPETFKEQIEIVKKYKPKFAIIAGGRPQQAFTLEKEGVTTYLHVPSPILLKLYIEEGIKNFVFEGNECGGHVGRYTSFVLWEHVVRILSENSNSSEYNLLFAGGILDEISSAMVATIASPLVEHGINIGVLLGTGYLFTEETVKSGAITEDFQKCLLGENTTVVLSDGSHRIRCVPTEFVGTFESLKSKLQKEGESFDGVRSALEKLIIGRLRIAAKGVVFNPESIKNPSLPNTIKVPKSERIKEGVYMAGQIVSRCNSPFTVSELHNKISIKGSEFLDNLSVPEKYPASPKTHSEKVEIAIVGMSGNFPKASDLGSYWENILNKVNAITEVPPERWDWREYYNPTPKTKDKINAHWGGFTEPVIFDPIKYGIPPNSLKSIDPIQILALEFAQRALKDAGYMQKDFDRENTSVILGVGGGLGDFGSLYSLRSLLPSFMNEVPPEVFKQLPEWTEDSFPGLLPNIVAGRIANFLNLGGVNFSVDAACATSLAALSLGVKELILSSSNMVIVGAIEVLQNPFAYLCFEKTSALSPTGKVLSFDANADGTVISEGVGVVVLKRLQDAVRDGDKIYAVIRGIGGSSDGRGKSLTAPKSEGQRRAIRRAYQQAQFPISRVELVETHGTGTKVGDETEAKSLELEFRTPGTPAKVCAVGSVKSMIGHTKSAAGMAGLIKTALSIYYKVLPPTLGVKEPYPLSSWDSKSPIYLNMEAKPWIGSRGTRRAGVSAFGFGGTDFHVALEEYEGNRDIKSFYPIVNWPSELFFWREETTEAIVEHLEVLESVIEKSKDLSLCDLAYTIYLENSKPVRNKFLNGSKKKLNPNKNVILAIVAESLDELKKKLKSAKDSLKEHPQFIPARSGIMSGAGGRDTKGIYFSSRPMAKDGKIAFLFSGQGSQRPNMLKDLAILFPQMRDSILKADLTLKGRLPQFISEYIFPPSAFTSEEEQLQTKELTQTNIAQPALGAVEVGLLKVMKLFGVNADMVAGHSLGEYVALYAGGVFEEETLYELLEYRGSAIMNSGKGSNLGKMLAVGGNAEDIRKIIKDLNDVYPVRNRLPLGDRTEMPEALPISNGVYIANLNSPTQTILSGSEEALNLASAKLEAKGFRCKKINVSCAFHSPYMTPVRDLLFKKLSSLNYKNPSIPVYSNLSATQYPKDKKSILSILSDHLISPVKFKDEVEKMSKDGAKIFLEIGPGNVLTNLVKQILADKEHLAIPCNIKTAPDISQILNVLAQLMSEGCRINLSPLFDGRGVKELNIKEGIFEKDGKELKPTNWMVASDRAWPVAEPRPVRKKTELLHSKKGEYPDFLKGLDVSKDLNSDSSSEVVLRYQKLMAKFLDYQREIMFTFLKGKPIENIEEKEEAKIEEKVERENITEEVAKKAQLEPSLQEKDLKGKLVEIVSERTGYPPEMLDFKLNIEADLGIDSIKKVEILSAFAKVVPGTTSELLEKLTGAKTLGDILEFVGSSNEKPNLAVSDKLKKTEGVKKEIISLRRLELESSSKIKLPSGIIIITDDGKGYAEFLKKEIEKLGGEAAIIRQGDSDTNTKENIFSVNLAKADSVESFVKEIKEKHAQIGAIVHLLSLRETPEFGGISLKEWQKSVNEEVKGLFHLLKYSSIYSTEWKPNVIACMRFGGKWVDRKLPSPDYPSRGGIMGIVKTLSLEWPEVICKAISISKSVSGKDLTGKILNELTLNDGKKEIYYHENSRWVLEVSEAKVDNKGKAKVEIGKDDVILVIGGARGITAQAAIELADKYKPVILLAGRSPWPKDESTSTINITSERELKKILHEKMLKEGRNPAPNEVEEAYQRIIMDREIRKTYDELKKAGSEVFYYQVDVKDEEAFSDFIKKIYQKHGHIDGVINGAGIIEDKLLEDKTPESFERVFETKVKSSFILSKKLDISKLKFLVFFSSIAGAFGNKGQIDYSAANEILNRLALHLNNRFKTRIIAINWGPWAEVGMVKEAVEQQFRGKGIPLISPLSGRKAFLDEICYGDPQHTLVVIEGTEEK